MIRISCIYKNQCKLGWSLFQIQEEINNEIIEVFGRFVRCNVT